MNKRMIELEVLGTGSILPAFLVGYELDGSADSRFGQIADCPSWIVRVSQQAGGYCMSYPTFVGTILRLSHNTLGGRKGAGELIRGLRLMAEDPDTRTLKREYPILHSMVGTSGEPYSQRTLKAFEAFLSDFVSVPQIESGIEALIRCATCEPLNYFRNWNMMSAEIRTDGPIRNSVYDLHGQKIYYVDESNLSDLIISDPARFTEDSLDSLSRIGQALGIHGSPRVFLLWENSD